MRISVFGLGYVGTVSVGCLAGDGHRVIGVDPNVTKVSMINGGQSPIIEDEIDELVANGVSAALVSATSDANEAIAATEVSLVCVGTPSLPNGSLNLEYVENVCRQIGAALGEKSEAHTVVIRSTMLPGSMQDVVIPALEAASGKLAGEGFVVVNNPEFLREGTAVFDYRNPPKTVIGELRPGDGDKLVQLYAGIDAPMIRTSIETAEMVKYVDNIWHALKVGFANEVGNIAKALGIDGQDVMKIFCADEKLNLSPYYLRPGFAFGGSCLPKDLRAMTYKANRLDVDTPILNSILPSNTLQVERAVNRVLESGKRKIGVLGFSFKDGTDDLRESPVVEMIERLLGKGLDVRIYDKHVNLARLVGANRDYILNAIPHIARIMQKDVDSILDTSELVVIGNGSAEFSGISDRLRPGQMLFDLVGVAKPTSSTPAYDGICW